METWILQYSHFRQMQLLDRVKKHPVFAAQLAAAFALILAASLALFLYLRRPRCRDHVLCALRPLLAKLEKEGFVREEGETIHRLFERYLAVHPGSCLAGVDRLYHRLQYGETPGETGALKQAVRAFLHEKPVD